MSKYKRETIGINNRPQGWTKNNAETKFYHKDNWVIAYYCNLGISYWIIDESYNYGCYLIENKQKFLEEKHMLNVRKTPVWRALHGEYDDE